MAFSLFGCGSQPQPAGVSEGASADPVFRTGWNLGNTLDANGCIDSPVAADQGLASETCWGMPETTAAMIQGIADSGMKILRVPVSWSNHLTDGDCTIDPAWMDRVHEIVGWARDAGLEVIINIHHDNYYEEASFSRSGGGWGYYPSKSGREKSLRFVRRVWEQVAEEFKDTDMMFETLNEPRLRGGEHEWSYTERCSTCRESMSVINELNQMAVDTIRKAGGKNETRLILVPSYAASPYFAVNTSFKMPDDPADNLCLSVHAYTPYNFAMQKNSEGGTAVFSQSVKNDLDHQFTLLRANFTSKGVPVVIGEYGATNKDNTADRVKWFGYYLTSARNCGIPCVLWDNNAPHNPDASERFGFYDREKREWYFPEIHEAILNSMR